MQVIKALKLSGVQGAYIPNMEPEVMEPVQPKQEPQDPTELLMSQLQLLDTATRRALLAEAFADDIKTVVNEAKEEGFQAGQELARQAIDEAILEEKEVLVELIETWTGNVNQSLEEQPWVIDEEERICELLFTSLCQLLTVTLSAPNNTHELLKSVVANHVDKNIKEVAISSAQFGHLAELNALETFGDNVKVIADESISPGSYKVSLSSGYITHQMDEALFQFKQDLNDIALGKEIADA